jgi:hypothetical protein
MRWWKRALVSIAISFASFAAIAQDLTGVWRDENGARYAVRQSGNDVCWSMERLPAASSVFCGSVMPPLIVGTWMDLPTGQRRGAGELVLRVENGNRIVRVSDAQGYGASTWIREGTSGAGAAGGGGGGSTSGGWGNPTAGSGGSSPPSGSTVASLPPAVFPAPPSKSSGSSEFTRKPGMTYAGGTPIIRYYGMRDAFPGACEADCAREAACAAYTYIRPGGYNAGDPPVCYLFSQAGYTVNNDCCTSGERSRPAGGSITGTWLFRGIAGQICTIAAADSSRLIVITEKGMRGEGLVSADNVLNVLYPFGPIRGQISADRNRINWSNGEFWTRAGATTAGGATTGSAGGNVGVATGGTGGGSPSAGCDDIKGRWNYIVGNSGAHIYVYHESFPPGSWAMGGGEVNVNIPEHNDRWGPVVCLGNNRFEFRRKTGPPFLVATLRDGKLVQDDGTHWAR